MSTGKQGGFTTVIVIFFILVTSILAALVASLSRYSVDGNLGAYQFARVDSVARSGLSKLIIETQAAKACPTEETLVLTHAQDISLTLRCESGPTGADLSGCQADAHTCYYRLTSQATSQGETRYQQRRSIMMRLARACEPHPKGKGCKGFDDNNGGNGNGGGNNGHGNGDQDPGGNSGGNNNGENADGNSGNSGNSGNNGHGGGGNTDNSHGNGANNNNGGNGNGGGNNGHGNGDQEAPGGSEANNGAENDTSSEQDGLVAGAIETTIDALDGLL